MSGGKAGHSPALSQTNSTTKDVGNNDDNDSNADAESFCMVEDAHMQEPTENITFDQFLDQAVSSDDTRNQGHVGQSLGQDHHPKSLKRSEAMQDSEENKTVKQNNKSYYVNAGFEPDEDGFVFVDEFEDQRVALSEEKTKNQNRSRANENKQVELEEVVLFDAERNKTKTNKSKSNKREEVRVGQSDTDRAIELSDLSLHTTLVQKDKLRSGSGSRTASRQAQASYSPQPHIDHINVITVNQTRPRRTGETDRSVRPQSRSISSFPAIQAYNVNDAARGPPSNPTQRSQSMRIQPTHEAGKKKARRLLRDLSFSDADASRIRNYGALRNGNSMPRRKTSIREGKENEINEEDEEETTPQITPDFKEHLEDLMQELLDRGKVQQVAVITQDGQTMLASLPTSWRLGGQDMLGLAKGTLDTHQMMLKLRVGDEMYTCLKHGKTKLVGHSGDHVLVAEKSVTCVVVGVASNQVPGSSAHEVSQLTGVLLDKGW